MDQRKHKRFQVHEGVFVVCGPYSNKLGQIMDISMGGLAFRYVAGNHESSEPFELDIFFTGHGCYMSKLPFRTISDFEIVNEIPFSSVTIRRCGVQFGRLMPHQISQLEYLIREHTTATI